MNDFETWMEYKRTKAEHDNAVAEFDSLKNLFYVIDRVCFGGLCKQMGVKPWYITPNIERQGLFGTYLSKHKSVMISQAYYKEHGIDRDVMRLVFHEIIHVYCDAKGIRDVSGKKHLRAFADACKDHGGYAEWDNDVRGYNDVYLTDDTYNRIQTALKG